MRISIVVPSFNQARYLDAALRSLVEQDHPDKEIIVLDGGSTDGSVDVIRRYESHLRLWRSEPDGGQTAAIAAGFGMASGEIIGWLNSDDVLAPGALQRVAREAARIGTTDAVFYGAFEVTDTEDQVQEVFFVTPIIKRLARAIGPAICQPGTFFGRDVYTRVGGLDVLLKYAMDFDLWMRFLISDVQFVPIRAVQGQFRRHPMQKGHSLEWLRRCAAEEAAVQIRYGLAPRGSLRRMLSVQAQRGLAIVRGGFHRTLAIRIVRRRRLREFAVTYST